MSGGRPRLVGIVLADADVGICIEGEHPSRRRVHRELVHRARADEDGLEESIVYPLNVSKADRVHELSDLCHRDREIGALQNGGAIRCAVRWRDLQRKVVSWSPPTPDLAQMIATPCPGALSVRPQLNRPGRRR